jgi:hypothetical protein
VLSIARNGKPRLSCVREKRFEPGEESFDPMEIGAVTPQIKEAGTGRRARLLDAGLVHGQGSMGRYRAEFRMAAVLAIDPMGVWLATGAL